MKGIFLFAAVLMGITSCTVAPESINRRTGKTHAQPSKCEIFEFQLDSNGE